MNPNSVIKILFLAANPNNTTRLRLDEELREIDEGRLRATHRDRFELKQKWAVRPQDLQRAILDFSPQIVHFSGHGLGTERSGQTALEMRDISVLPESELEPEGLMFEDDAGQGKLVETGAISNLFELFANQIDCVVLNACYSANQAEAIAQHIPYVIGMNRAIGDKAALVFSRGFYDALWAGRDFEFAYKSGCVAIKTAGISEELTPVLEKNTEITLQGSYVYPRTDPKFNDKDLQDYLPRERLQKIITTPLSKKLLTNPRKIGYRNTRSLLVDFVSLCIFSSLILPPILLFTLFSILPNLDVLSSLILAVIIYICFALFLYYFFGNTLLRAYNNLKKGKEYTKIYDITIIPGFILEKQPNEIIQTEKTVQEFLVYTFQDLQSVRYKINQEISKSQLIQINDTGFAYLGESKKLTGFMIHDFIRINSDKEYETICDQFLR